jgi:hypothetical protein
MFRNPLSADERLEPQMGEFISSQPRYFQLYLENYSIASPSRVVLVAAWP